MPKQEEESKSTSRRSFAKSIATAIAMVPFVAPRTSAQGEMLTQHIPTRRRTAVSQKPGTVVDDSPITVGGGGGSHLPKKFRDFRHSYVYIEKPEHYHDKTLGGPKKKLFRNDDFVMRSIIVWLNGIEFNLSSLLTADGTCKITVSLVGGADHELIIFCNWNKPGMNGMGVKFHTGKYPPNSEYDMHPNPSPYETNYIEKISVITDVGSFERQGLTNTDMVEIRVGLL